MKKSLIIIILFICCFPLYVLGQQTPVFSEYNFNPFIVNPAYAGFNSSTELTASNNGYFNEFDGSPRNLAFTLNAQSANGTIGYGLGAIRDQIGVTSITSLYGAYAYKLSFRGNKNRPAYNYQTQHVLSFGITAGIQMFEDNLLELGIDNDLNFSENINTTIPIVGAGIVWNKENLFVGLSSPNLIRSIYKNDELTLKNTYYAYAGYRIFSNGFKTLLIKPSILAKYEQGAPAQFDFNTTFTYKSKFEFGVGYRSTSSVNALIGIQAFDNLRFIYSYNQAVGNSVLANSHGILVSYRFGEGYKIDYIN